MTVQDTASKKDKFDRSMEMLKGYYDALESRIEKTVALLLVVVGWLITSGTARESITKDPALFWGAVVTLTALIIFLTFNIGRFFYKFKKIRAQAVDLEYMEPEYFSRYPEMNNWYLLFYLTPVLTFYFFILLLLIQIRFNSFSWFFSNSNLAK